MTTVLIVDANDESRRALEAQLMDSNQFEKVLSCAAPADALSLIHTHAVKVVLLDADEAEKSPVLQHIKQADPDIGVVLIQGNRGSLTPANLLELGAHAQTSRVAATMDIIASVAKALVARLRPSGGILGKFLKDGK
ncbi:MAG TPA: response regulator [Limnobacter sp.]|nr:response regulator [Limnobacter sp.]